MLVINFDIAEGDFKGFYMDKYKNAPRDNNNPVEPKYQGRYFMLLEGDGYEGRLKAFITSVEESNSGYTWDWNEESLKGKLFGGIFRTEEYIGFDGSIRESTKLYQVRSVKTIHEGKYEIPRKKEVQIEEELPASEFLKPATDDDLPF